MRAVFVSLLLVAFALTGPAVGAAAISGEAGGQASQVTATATGGLALGQYVAAPNAQEDGNGTNGTARSAERRNASLGASISAFMQASAADADSEVENGMFDARYENSEGAQRDNLVSQRVTELRNDVAELRQERAALLNSSEVGVEQRARAARLTARINGIERSLDRTESAATESGVGTEEIQRIRENARSLSGPEVAAMARGMNDRDRSDRGPGNSNAGEARGNGSARGGDVSERVGNGTNASEGANDTNASRGADGSHPSNGGQSDGQGSDNRNQSAEENANDDEADEESTES